MTCPFCSTAAPVGSTVCPQCGGCLFVSLLRLISARCGLRGPFDLFSQQGISVQTTTVPVLRERGIMYPPFGPYCAVCQVSPVSNKPFLVDLTRR